MDATLVDLTDVPGAAVGMEAVLIEADNDSPLSAAAVAALCGTIPYEILTGISPRARRRVRAVGPRRSTGLTQPQAVDRMAPCHGLKATAGKVRGERKKKAAMECSMTNEEGLRPCWRLSSGW